MSRKIVTWAVAALLAAPAVPMFAKTTVTKKLTSHHVHHKALVTSSSKKHRTLHHHRVRHTSLTTSARAGRKLSSSIKHSAKPAASASHAHVQMMNQPTIDGMHT